MSASIETIDLEQNTIDEVNRRILAERARLLAIPTTAPGTETTLTVLHFQLAYEQYAIETKYLKEALFVKEITTLPLTPNFVLGVVSVRGDIISALDIRKFFNLPGEPLNDLNRLLVLQDKDMTFGVLVDRIREIKEIPVSGIMKGQVSHAGIHADYIFGITTENIIVLNGSALINDPSIIVNQL